MRLIKKNDSVICAVIFFYKKYKKYSNKQKNPNLKS